MKRIAALLLMALAGWAQAGTLGLHIGSQHYPAKDLQTPAADGCRQTPIKYLRPAYGTTPGWPTTT